MNRFHIIIIIIALSSLSLYSQEIIDSSSYYPLSQEAFSAISAMFHYDTSISAEASVLEKYETRTYIREKIVITGVRGDRVPGFLAIPKTGKPPYPLVLLFHVMAGSKESWWNPTSFERGLFMVDSLLVSNVAILALDAQYHGERSINSDFLPVDQMYFDKKWYHRYRDGIIETIGDYFKAVDYLASRGNINVNKIGVHGHSMGGQTALIYAALDERVRAVSASVAAHSDPWLFPISPLNLAGYISVPTLIQAGRQDNLVSIDATDLLFSSLRAEVKELAMYESGHRLPETNISRCVGWLVKYLQDK